MASTRVRIAIIVCGFLLLGVKPALAAGPGDRVKLACPSPTPASHPCKAVYYWGADGKRHAFPNEKTYFSWYADFSGVQTVSATAMAALPLGPNVTYRPGVKLVKFPTVPQTYAVDAGGVLRWVKTEEAARALYGATWNKTTDDLPEAFFTNYRFGADIASASDFNPEAVRAASPTIDAGSGASYEYKTVATSRGNFDAHVVTLDRARFRMKTYDASAADCSADCAAKSLDTYVTGAGASIGIHGSYFCPPDYADCAAKINSFLWPMFDSGTGQMRNSGAIPLHEAPLIAEAQDGKLVYYRRAPPFGSPAAFQQTHGSPLDAALGNYPGLIDGGSVIVESESRLEEAQKTVKGTRGAIGWSDGKFFLVIAKSATVIDLAYVMQSLGATHAMNLDGGGSSALIYGGAYKVGPGRALPNAIVFTNR